MVDLFSIYPVVADATARGPQAVPMCMRWLLLSLEVVQFCRTAVVR
jgi:hypothetical protein